MKKILMLVLTGILVLSMTACGGASTPAPEDESGPSGKKVSLLTPYRDGDNKSVG